MFYKKIISLLLISVFMFQQIGYCDEAEESALMTILQYAKNEKQEKKAYFKLLQYYMREQDYESVIPVGNKLLKLKLSKKQKYNVYCNLSTSYLYTDKPEKALEVGREAQYLYPKKVETKLLLGNIYKNNSLNELAISEFKECLELDYDNLEALINLGNIYNCQENYKLSLEYFEKAQAEAIQNKTDLSIDDYINMAISAKEIGRRDQAQSILENIKKKNKTAALLLVNIYHSKHEYDKAIKTLMPFVYINETDIEIYCNLAQIYLLSNKFNEAKDLLLYFKSRNEGNNEVIDLLLIEAYHNIYQDKNRELKELKNIYNYTNLDYIKRIIGKVIKFEQSK
ncbi:MAG: hypothetical protein K5622_05090 [Endomicrobiaceae bacterium]|nr:hypothetical protein [Endomicrobiaceae bacterium]